MNELVLVLLIALATVPVIDLSRQLVELVKLPGWLKPVLVMGVGAGIGLWQGDLLAGLAGAGLGTLIISAFRMWAESHEVMTRRRDTRQ